VTLIAAIPCRDGFVLAADSQETVSCWDGTQSVDYRRTVQKITPRDMGVLSVIVAGSGNASLIDSFIPVLERKLSAESSDNLKDFVCCTEKVLADFYQADVALCPDADKTLKMFIAAVPKKTGECGVWLQKNVRLCPIADAELVGWEEALYVNSMKRFYSRDMTLQQGVLAAIYVLTIAEQTSNYVRGPMVVGVVKKNGMWMEKDEYVSAMTKRLHAYEQQVNDIFLACADTSIHGYQLEEKIKTFSQSAVELHKRHIDENVDSLTPNVLSTTNDPYPKYPLGSAISFGAAGFQFEHDPKKLRANLDEIKARWKDVRLPGKENSEEVKSSSDEEPKQ